jgi:hypothetical protein
MKKVQKSLSKNATISEFIKEAKALNGNKYIYGAVPNEKK